MTTRTVGQAFCAWLATMLVCTAVQAQGTTAIDVSSYTQITVQSGQSLDIVFDVRDYARLASANGYPVNPTSFLFAVGGYTTTAPFYFDMSVQLLSNDQTIDLPSSASFSSSIFVSNGGPTEPIDAINASWSFSTSTSIALFGATGQNTATIRLKNLGDPFSIQAPQYYLENFPGVYKLPNNVILIGGVQASSNFVTGGFVEAVTLITPIFAGTPGKANCFGKSISTLSKQYGGLNNAAAALGFSSVNALQGEILGFCEA